jgi:hypothetical protein
MMPPPPTAEALGACHLGIVYAHQRNGDLALIDPTLLDLQQVWNSMLNHQHTQDDFYRRAVPADYQRLRIVFRRASLHRLEHAIMVEQPIQLGPHRSICMPRLGMRSKRFNGS